jgi:cardiolipin synthase
MAGVGSAMSADGAGLAPGAAPGKVLERAGHAARWLTNGSEAYREVERQIDAANGSVRLECYLVRPDGPMVRLQEALLRAVRRGVRVFVLVDAYGSGDLPAAYFDRLSSAGARVRRFNPARLLRLSFRNHRKLLVCDRRCAVIGGFNIGPEYEGDGVRYGWRDMGLAISGPIAAQLADSFDEMFALAPFTPAALRRFRPVRRPPADADGTVTMLTSGPGCRSAALRRALHDDLRAGRVVMAMAAYFLPSGRMRRLLRRCVSRGGRVKLLLAGRTDVPFARLAATHLYPRLTAARVEIYEYQPQVLHAKLVVIDDVVYVGSCNLDKRSLQINFEVLLRLAWPELAAEARRIFLDDLDYATRVLPAPAARRPSWWQRLRALAAYWLLARIDPLVATHKLRALT